MTRKDAAAPAFDRAAAVVVASRGSPGTRAVYAANLARWRAHCDETGAKAEAPELADATAFRDVLKEALAPLTVRQILASLSAIYGELSKARRPVVTWNPFHPKVINPPKSTDYAKTEAADEGVVARMVAATKADETPDGARDHAILLLLRGTGMRRASIAGMQRRKVRRVGGAVVVEVAVKGGKEGMVELPADAAAALDRWLAVAPASEWVFPGKRRGSPICTDLINKIVRARAKQAGADGVHPHSFRSAFATELLDAGVPLHEVQAAMHHTDPKTTLRYDRGVRGSGVTRKLEEYRREKKKP